MFFVVFINLPCGCPLQTVFPKAAGNYPACCAEVDQATLQSQSTLYISRAEYTSPGTRVSG